jgi:hypothetical protein
MKSSGHPPVAFFLPPTAYCLLLTAHLPRSAVYDMMSPPRGKGRSSNFKN